MGLEGDWERERAGFEEVERRYLCSCGGAEVEEMEEALRRVVVSSAFGRAEVVSVMGRRGWVEAECADLEDDCELFEVRTNARMARTTSVRTRINR